MWFIGVEVEQEMSAPPPKKNPGSAPAGDETSNATWGSLFLRLLPRPLIFIFFCLQEQQKLVHLSRG